MCVRVCDMCSIMPLHTSGYLACELPEFLLVLPASRVGVVRLQMCNLDLCGFLVLELVSSRLCGKGFTH